MKIFFIEDEDGKYCSENGKRRFIRLEGKAAYNYLSEHKGLHFYRTVSAEKNGDKIFVEIPKKRNKEYERELNREKYLLRVKKRCEIKEIIFSSPVTRDGKMTVEDLLDDEDRNRALEDEVIDCLDRADKIEKLHRALCSLSASEYRIIDSLFLADSRMTERELAQSLGVSQPRVNRMKREIFLKIQKFFSDYGY